MEYYTNLTGDGTTKTFYFTFPFFGVNDIHVTVNNVEQTTDDYTLTATQTPNDADTEYTGGSIEFDTAPANGASVVIYREIDLTRHIDYQPTEKPLSHQLNQDFNQCMGALRELKIKLKNAIGLANIPNVADLLEQITRITENMPDCLTADDLSDINDAITSIASKTNIDMDNLSVAGKKTVSNLSMPGDTYIDYATNERAFTAPANGYYCVKASMGTNSMIRLENTANGATVSYMNTTNDSRAAGILLPVKKDASVTLTVNQTTPNLIRFIYAEGEI